jgi:hypothetical protein
LVLEAARTAAQLLSHKVRKRCDRLRGRQAPEDFNAVREIRKVATLVRKVT